MLDTNNLSQEVFKAVRLHIPEVELARHNGRELSLILPYSSVNKFASLFNELEVSINQGGNPLGISSYGISMNTLEEVDIRLCTVFLFIPISESYSSDIFRCSCI